MKSALYKKGMATRKKVMGKKHLAKRHASTDKFSMQQQEFRHQVRVGRLLVAQRPAAQDSQPRHARDDHGAQSSGRN